MSDHIKATIGDLQKKVVEQEAATNQTKKLVNQLAEMAGMPAVYTITDTEDAQVSMSTRADQFYGLPLATAVKEVLKLRRARTQEPSTVNEIYQTLVDGGYAFETSNEENRKRNLRISISKNTAMFHKLPNGKIGLLAWYPNAKIRKKAGVTVASDINGDDDDIDDGLGEAS